jgi:hypothetical protein
MISGSSRMPSPVKEIEDLGEHLAGGRPFRQAMTSSAPNKTGGVT